MDFHIMKRKELQALCKEHKIRANLTNLEMADRLSSIFKIKEKEKPVMEGKSSLMNSAKKMSENDCDVAEKRLKKAIFSTENEDKRIEITKKRSEVSSDEVFVAEGGIPQPEMRLRRSRRIAEKHVNRPKMGVQNANRRKLMMPKIQTVRIDIPVADEEVLEDNYQKGLESTPKSCLKKQNIVYIELSGSETVGNSVIQGGEEQETEKSPVVLSGNGVGESVAEGNEELEQEESPSSADVVADSSVIATVNDDILCCQTPLKGSDGSEQDDYHYGQKFRLQQEWIEASKTRLADRGAEIFDGVMSVREDSMYDDSVGVGCQESREEVTAVEETNKIDFEGKLCMDGAHHDFDGQLSLAGEKGMEITCSNSGDVKKIRTHETSIGETSSPIIFEERHIDRVFATVNDDFLCCRTPLKGSDESEQGIAVPLDETSRKVGEEEEPLGQNYDNTVSDDILCCQTPLKGSDESEHGMPISISETSRKVGDEWEPEEVMGKKEINDGLKVNMMQITEEEVTSPSSVESEQENQLKILFTTLDTTSTCSSEKQTYSHEAENVAISLENTENTLNTMIRGKFCHGESLEVVELKESEDTQGSALRHKGEETTAEGSNNIDATLPKAINFEVFQKQMTAELVERASLCVEEPDALKDQNAEQIVSPGLLGISKVMTENGNDSVKRNVNTLAAMVGYLPEEGGGCCEILGEVMPEIFSFAVLKADDCSRDMSFGETDCWMDKKDILVQKVLDVEATEVLLTNEDGMEEDVAAKLLHGNEAQTSAVEKNEAHGSSDYLDESPEERHSNQKLCLQHECIKLSDTTLADRGAEILDGIMSVGEDSVSNDSVEVGCQESREDAIAVEETTKIDLEGNLCVDGTHHNLDGQLSLVGEKGFQKTCSNSGDVKEIRTHETPTGETSSPIIFEETEIDRTGIMYSAYEAAGLSATVIDYILHCQTPLKGSESEEGIAMSLEDTSRMVGEADEPQEVIEAKENDDVCLFKVNVMQKTEEEVSSPGSAESERENQLGMLFATPDTFSTCCNEKKSPSNDAENAEGTAFRSNESDAECLLKFNSLQTTVKEITGPGSMESEQENLLQILFVTPDTASTSFSKQQTSSHAAEISTVSMSSENTLKKSILGRFSHVKSQGVVEFKEREINEGNTLKSNGEEITGKVSNSIDEEIASSGSLGIGKVMFEDGSESIKGKVNTLSGDLLEEGGGCIEISGKVTAEVLRDAVFKADDCVKVLSDDVVEAAELTEASSGTKLSVTDQSPANYDFASDKVAAAVDVWKGQLAKDIPETKASEAILEGNIPVRHLFSTSLTQKTPGKLIMSAAMKENAQSFKRQPGSLISAKSTKKRRPLEEL